MSGPISLLAESCSLFRSNMFVSEFPKRPVYSHRLELQPLEIKYLRFLFIEPLKFSQYPRSESTRSPQALISVNTKPCASNPTSSTIRKEKLCELILHPKQSLSSAGPAPSVGRTCVYDGVLQHGGCANRNKPSGGG
jgi:hypothetical protein